MRDDQIRVGVIGCGGMGSDHVRNLTGYVAGAKVVAVMDADRPRAENVASECRVANVHTDAQALIASADVDAVVIASPDFTHAELTLACLAAGKPVLCEKPLARTAQEAKRIVDAEAKQNRRLVQVGFMREYDPAHLAAKQVLDARELGPALMFRGVHNNMSKGHPREVDDVITNSAVHDIHSARWLMGQEITQVNVQYIPNHPERPTTCRLLLVQLTFSDGTLGCIEVNSESGYGYEVYVEITCEQGQITSTALTSPAVRRSGILGHAVEPDWIPRFAAAYRAELHGWVSSVAAGRADGPSALDGYRALVVTDACQRAARSGNAEPVSD